MRFAPFAVACSFLLSSAIVAAALWSTPAMHRQFANYGATQWASASGVLLPIVAVCGWPWLVSFVRAFGERSYRSSTAFAVAGFALSLVFYMPISSAPSEGIGYYVVIFVLLAWVAYPLSLLARGGTP